MIENLPARAGFFIVYRWRKFWGYRESYPVRPYASFPTVGASASSGFVRRPPNVQADFEPRTGCRFEPQSSIIIPRHRKSGDNLDTAAFPSVRPRACASDFEPCPMSYFNTSFFSINFLISFSLLIRYDCKYIFSTLSIYFKTAHKYSPFLRVVKTNSLPSLTICSGFPKKSGRNA